MKVTIISQDQFVSIEGEGYYGINLSDIDPNIHAVQWYDVEGIVEIKDARGNICENRVITSFDDFTFVVPLWEAVKAKSDKDKAEFAPFQKEHDAQIAEIEVQIKAQLQAQAQAQLQTP